MKIIKIKVYKIGLPLKEASYKWSHNSEVKEFDNTIVKIETDSTTQSGGAKELWSSGSSYVTSSY